MGSGCSTVFGPLRAFYQARIVTVEVIVIFFILGKMVYMPLVEQYYYHKYGSVILRNTSFQFPNGSFCVSSELINNSTGDNNSYKTVEAQSNHLVAYGQVATTIPAVLVTVLMGPMIDKYGRKIGIILPAIGTVLQGVLSILVIVFDLHPYYFIVVNAVYGLSGSYTILLASCFAYIADVSTVRWRSFRVGIAESGMSFGGAVGTLLGGYWLRKVSCNFVPLMSFYVGINLFVLLYTIFAIPESLSSSERAKMREKNPGGIKAMIQGVKLYFGGLSLRSTWILYVTTITLIVEGINIFGAIMIDVYFLKALPFDFTAFQVGVYEAVRSVSQGLANFLGMAVLVALHIGDAWIILLAVLAHVATNMLLGFATRTWQLYAIVAGKGIEGLMWPAVRGFLSKLVRPEQQGALFSVIAAVEAVMTLLASTIWPVIFPLTLQHNMRPGMTFIFMAATASLLLPLIISLLPLRKDYQEDTNRDPLLKKDANHVQKYQSINNTY